MSAKTVAEPWVELAAAVLWRAPRLPDAACIGRGELFDAANASADDIAAAKALCARCECFAACSQWASGQRHLVGVVAGKYHQSKRDEDTGPDHPISNGDKVKQ